jgi:ABC-type multidrug transport system fused ATPase/permease subunit
MKELISNLKKTWEYTKDNKKELIICIIGGILSIIISVITPILSAKVILNLTSNQFKQLIFIGLVIFGVEITKNIVRYFIHNNMQIIYRESYTKIQEALSNNILKLQNKTIDSNSSGVFIQRLTNDTSKMADVFTSILDYLTAIITDIGVFIAIFIVNKIVFLFIAVMVTILFIIYNRKNIIFNEANKLLRKENEKITGFVGEMVRGARDIKMLDAEDSFLTNLDKRLVDYNQHRYDALKINWKYNFWGGSITDFTNLMLIFLLVYLIISNKLVVASALILYNYARNVYSVVVSVDNLFVNMKDYNLSASRIFAILDDQEFPKEKFGTRHINKINGDFEFKKVNFAYGNKKILKDLSFQVHANETVAFVGKSGAGKTTIFNLLCKMYDITSGSITIDGIDIKELDKDSIRGNITIISQDPYIFNVSIKDNLKLVKDNLTDKDMIEACKLACLHDYIMSLPDKYDTIIGEGGVNLSGGQKQRLAIARALVQKTEIILFDEATSALDNETQSQIQKAIDNMKNEYTILIIAHRLSTVINSDRILFLNNGHIEAAGTHEELLKKSVNYQKLYEAELKHHK